jgi:N-acetylglucosaminyl-diphospho-decaprenol L-rhamnosyltransferase
VTEEELAQARVGPVGVGQCEPLESRVGAVVVAFGSTEELHRCLESLVLEGISEIVVVDNADPYQRSYTKEIGGFSILYHSTGRNLGYGRAVNLGVSLTTTPFIIVANPDVEFHAGSLKALLDGFHDEVVAVTAPKVLNIDGSRYPSFREFPRLGAAAVHGLVGLVSANTKATQAYRGDLLDPAVPTKVPWVSGAALTIRRRAFVEVGGFDAQYFLYLEDVDLCRRLKTRGWDVVYVPDAVVVHRQGSSSRLRPVRSRLQHHRSLWIYARATLSHWPVLMVSGAGIWLRFVLQSMLWREKKS